MQLDRPAPSCQTWIRTVPIVGPDAIEIGHAGAGHNFDAIIAEVGNDQTSIARFGHAGRLKKFSKQDGITIFVGVNEIAGAIETGVGGDDAAGGINEINAVAAGIANSQQAVVFYHEALQISAGIGNGGDDIADAERGNLKHLVALDGDINVIVEIQCQADGVGQVCRIGGNQCGKQIIVDGELQNVAIVSVAAVEDKKVIGTVNGDANRMIEEIGYQV